MIVITPSDIIVGVALVASIVFYFGMLAWSKRRHR